MTESNSRSIPPKINNQQIHQNTAETKNILNENPQSIPPQTEIVKPYIEPSNELPITPITTPEKEPRIFKDQTTNARTKPLTSYPKILPERKSEDNESSPIEEKELCEKTVIKEVYDYGLIKYGKSGSYGDNGLLKITPEGYEFIRRSENYLEKKQSSEDQKPILEGENEFNAVVLDVSDDTVILTSDQIHAVFVKGNPQIDYNVQAFADATSQAKVAQGTELTEAPANIQVYPTQPFSGKDQPQYVVPLVPPLTVSSDACKPVETSPTLHNFLQDPKANIILTDIFTEVAKTPPEPYTGVGITLEKLDEILQAKKNQENKNSTPNNNKEQEPDEEVD